MDKKIKKLITRFFHGNESHNSRLELYEWFQNIQADAPSLSKRVIQKSQADNKNRILRQIGAPRVANANKAYRYFAVAVCLLFILMMPELFHILTKTEKRVNIEVLAKIFPQQPRRLLALSSGDTIDVDQLLPSKELIVKGIQFKLSKNGSISYKIDEHFIHKPLFITVITGSATQSSVQLNDGTYVTLNANSNLRFPVIFNKDTRHVWLIGEGYFHVSKTMNRNRFLVETKQQVVEVLGTKFNIRGYNNERSIQTTLVEGSVKLNFGTYKALFLRPGEQALNDGNVATVHPANAQHISTWKDGFFVFEGRNLQQSFQEIADWYNVDIQTSGLRHTSYEGEIPKGLKLSKLVQVLIYAGFDISVNEQENKRFKITIK